MPKSRKKSLKKAPLLAKRSPILKILGVSLILAIGLLFARQNLTQNADIMQIGGMSIPNQALRLDGNTFISANDSSSALNPKLSEGFTFEAWYKPQNYTFGPSRLINKNNAYDSVYSIWLESQYNKEIGIYSVVYHLEMGKDDCEPSNHLTFSRTLEYSPDNKDQITTWHHIAGVLSPDGTVSLFVDGDKYTSVEKLVSTCQSSKTNLEIGYRSSPTNWIDGKFIGTIDEVRISNLALYGANFIPETSFNPEVGTVALYKFDGRLSDLSSYARHPSIVGVEYYTESQGTYPPPTSDPSTNITCSPALYRIPNGAPAANQLTQYLSPQYEVSAKNAIVKPGEYYVHAVRVSNNGERDIATSGYMFTVKAENGYGNSKSDWQSIWTAQITPPYNCTQKSPNEITCPVEHFALAAGESAILELPVFASKISESSSPIDVSGYHVTLGYSQIDGVMKDCGVEVMTREGVQPSPVPSSPGCYFKPRPCPMNEPDCKPEWVCPSSTPTPMPKPSPSPVPSFTPQPTPSCEIATLSKISYSKWCGVGKYRQIAFTCSNGSTYRQGSTSTCKTKTAWRQIAKEYCGNYYVCINPSPTPPPPSPQPSSR